MFGGSDKCLNNINYERASNPAGNGRHTLSVSSSFGHHSPTRSRQAIRVQMAHSAAYAYLENSRKVLHGFVVSHISTFPTSIPYSSPPAPEEVWLGDQPQEKEACHLVAVFSWGSSSSTEEIKRVSRLTSEGQKSATIVFNGTPRNHSFSGSGGNSTYLASALHSALARWR